MNCKEQDDPYLIDAIKKSFITEPSFEKEYKFNLPLGKLDLKGQSELPFDVDGIVFKNKLRNGFFIEARL